jgi:hypothetical protein
MATYTQGNNVKPMFGRIGFVMIFSRLIVAILAGLGPYRGQLSGLNSKLYRRVCFGRNLAFFGLPVLAHQIGLMTQKFRTCPALLFVGRPAISVALLTPAIKAINTAFILPEFRSIFDLSAPCALLGSYKNGVCFWSNIFRFFSIAFSASGVCTVSTPAIKPANQFRVWAKIDRHFYLFASSALSFCDHKNTSLAQLLIVVTRIGSAKEVQNNDTSGAMIKQNYSRDKRYYTRFRAFYQLGVVS